MTTYNRAESWYTDSDDNFEINLPATDPRTITGTRTSLSSTTVSQPYAMIPLPNQFHLYTIDETSNQEEDTEPSVASIQRQAESMTIKNEELIEKSLKSISMIRSRLLQQQESNRKKNCEFQQIRASLEIIQSLVHLVHDERCHKTWIEFSTEELKNSSNFKNLRLSKIEKQRTSFRNDCSELSMDEVEPRTPRQILVTSLAQSDMDGPARSYQAMSISTNVPTTPTKAERVTPTPTPTSEILNLYSHQSSDDLAAIVNLTPRMGIMTPQDQYSFFKTQPSRFNAEKAAAVTNEPVAPSEYENSPGNLSLTSISATMSTEHDDEWYRQDGPVHASESTSTDGKSEASSFRKISNGNSPYTPMALKFRQFTRVER
ncbi:hypothetical protein VP01_2016g1 [Puccinia sorghi]|uniref:Uncharacterized protein n=1 Tax=Puccinia sorghi TaxID=27349 RepID=A0A0L6VBT3_9BASI|nr:hypothetical protein VP01_2016g1 [Puccinia sorghi]